MTQTITAVFDGQVLRPEAPLDLQVNSRYLITITGPENGSAPEAGWDALFALAGCVEAPSDWSSEHDHYLYGAPKRSKQGNE